MTGLNMANSRHSVALPQTSGLSSMGKTGAKQQATASQQLGGGKSPDLNAASKLVMAKQSSNQRVTNNTATTATTASSNAANSSSATNAPAASRISRIGKGGAAQNAQQSNTQATSNAKKNVGPR